MTERQHLQAISISLGLYFVALMISMAGMEIFGWLTIALTLGWLMRRPRTETLTPRDIAPFMPWKACLMLLAITACGLLVNGTATADPVYDLGSQRWMFLMAGMSVAVGLRFPTWRGYRVFLAFAFVIAVYAVVQSFTGIDLLRPGSHRAVQELSADMPGVYRSAGFFGSPMQHAYVGGQWACLALAMVLLLKKRDRLFWASLSTLVVLAASLVTTYTRGSWIAMAITVLVMIYIVMPRFGIWVVAAGTAATGALFFGLEQFRFRLVSLFDSNYSSNSDRLTLWKANWLMFLDYPILGIGYQENETRAGEYVARLGFPDAFTGHAHNNYLQMLAGTGLLGFSTYLFIIGFMMRVTWQLYRKIPTDLVWARAVALGAFGAQLQLHIGGFTECNFKTGITSHNLMMVWALVVALSAAHSKGLLRSARFNGDVTPTP